MSLYKNDSLRFKHIKILKHNNVLIKAIAIGVITISISLLLRTNALSTSCQQVYSTNEEIFLSSTVKTNITPTDASTRDVTSSAILSNNSNTDDEKKQVKKLVALTFDDGPSNTNTLKILNVLREHNCNATFFVLGTCAKKYPDIVEKVYEAGNEIGLHSMNHENFTKLSEKERESNLEKECKTIYKIIGVNPTLFRPPGGKYNDEMKKYLDYPIIRWAKDSNDWRNISDDKVIDNIMINLKAGDIILCHDIKPRTLVIVKKVIPMIQKKGIEITTISDMFEYYDAELENGHVYKRVPIKTKKIKY
jgi:peptidoglycan/xylan/chitin deacetylase (PgdA/CDA1 family)